MEKGKLFNYADDNTHILILSHCQQFQNRKVLFSSTGSPLTKMKANPDEFQAFAVGAKTLDDNPTFNIGRGRDLG